MQYNITFTPTIGSSGTLVEFKKSSSSIWITPNHVPNPTTLSHYPLYLDPSTEYDVRISSVGQNCSSRSVILKLITQSGSITTTTTTTVAPPNCCPVDYTLSPDGTYCYKVEEAAPTAPTSTENLVAKSAIQYSTCGTYIYDPGFSLNGTGASTQIPVSNPYWVNGAGSCVDSTITDGPLNRTGVWATTTSNSQKVGFSVCLTLPSTKTYYIGVGCDNFSSISIDGTLVLDQNEVDLATFYGGLSGATFKIWHIYPINLLAGTRVIEIVGNNVSSIAGFGCQIYDNSYSQLVNATSDGDLNIIFNSRDYVGSPVVIGSGGIGYTCPAGYSLDICSSPYRCVKVSTTSIIPC